jgi:hypothetical protein
MNKIKFEYIYIDKTKFKKGIYYEHQTNTIYFINNTIYSHYLGAFVFCPKNIDLLGGNSQPGCEIYTPNNISLFNSLTTTLIKK